MPILLFILLVPFIFPAKAATQVAKEVTKTQQAWSFSKSLNIDPLNVSGIIVNEQFMALATDEGNQIELFAPSKKGAWQSLHTLTLTRNLDEIDIEALAWQKPYLYALGSHSAKRKKIKDNLSQKDNMKRLEHAFLEPARQQLFRVELDAQANMVEIQTLSLTDVLANHSILKTFVGIPSKENGIDIEGLAIDHKGRLLFGFRGPVLRGNIALVLRVQLEKKAFKVKKTKTLFLHAQGLGIRGLSEMEQDFLVLTGAVGDQAMPYQVSMWDGKNALEGNDYNRKGFTHLCNLPDTGGKPEGIHFIKSSQNQIEFVIVNDGLKAGKPTQYQCPMP